jgi:predicted RNase H-like nuclease (RuvC/YqgF family)
VCSSDLRHAKDKRKLRAIKKEFASLEAQSNRKDAEINELRMENEKSAVERDDLQRKLEEAPNQENERLEEEIKNREIAKLTTALDELSRQLDATSEDLANESQCKSKLVELVQREAQAVAYAEGGIKQLSRKIQR